MKHLIFAATLLPILLMSACAGVTARNEVLLPAMYAAYTDGEPYNGSGIYFDIRRGISAKTRSALDQRELRLLADDMGDALKKGDVARVVRIDWSRLRALALIGIGARVAAGEIGEGVALSYVERVTLFSASFKLLLK